MSNYVVVAIDWTGLSECEEGARALEPFKPKCPPECQIYVSASAEISFSQRISNCQVTKRADLSKPNLVISLSFKEFDEANQWMTNYKKCFDFVQLLSY